MTITSVISELKTATHPIVKVLHKAGNFKVLILGFNKGMILREHKTQITSKLTVLNGSVLYKEANRELKLLQYDEIEIPIDIIHSVEAIEDSLCILTQG